MEGGREGRMKKEVINQSIKLAILSFFLGRQCLKDVDETQALK